MNKYIAYLRDKRTGDIFTVSFEAKCDKCAKKKLKHMKALTMAKFLYLVDVDKVRKDA